MFRFLIAFATSLLGAAADADLRPPTLGYIAGRDSGVVLRIAGIPGAAYTQEVFRSDAALDLLAVSSERSYALGVTEGNLVLIRLAPDPAAVSSLAGLAPPPDRIALSPKGFSAALYYQSGLLRLVTGLPESPAVRDEIFAGENVVALAVSDDGLVAIAAGDQGGSLLREGRNEALPVVGQVSAAAFAPDRHDAALVVGRDVYLATSLARQPEYKLLPGDGFVHPAGLAFSRDSSRLYVADPDAGAVHIFDRTASALRTIDCGGKPAGLEPLGGNAVFRLQNLSSEYLQVLEDDSPGPRVVFIPRAAALSN